MSSSIAVSSPIAGANGTTLSTPYIHSTYADGQEVSRHFVASQPQVVSAKDATAERIRCENDNDQRLAAGRLREIGPSGRTDRKWTSQRPNAHFAWDVVDNSFLNADAHQEAMDILEAWKFAPWKGAIFQGLYWVEETTYSGHWEPLADQLARYVVEPRPTPYAPYGGPLLTVEMTKDGINRAYETYMQNPKEELLALQVAMASFAPKGSRLSAAANLLNSAGADIYLQPEDIISDFALDLIRRFGKGQYKQEHPFHTWFAFVWNTYFFPEVQTKVFTYLKQTTFINSNDPDEAEYSHENHSVLQSDVELEMARHEAEGYALPISADRVLRQIDDPQSSLSGLSEPTKVMLRCMAAGLTKKEAAKRAGISPRQGRRLLEDALAASVGVSQ